MKKTGLFIDDPADAAQSTQETQSETDPGVAAAGATQETATTDAS